MLRRSMGAEPREWFVHVEMDATGSAVRTSVRVDHRLLMCHAARCSSEESAQYVDECLACARTGDAFECVVVSPSASAKLSRVGSPAVAKIWLVKTLFHVARVTRQAYGQDGMSTGTRWKAAASLSEDAGNRGALALSGATRRGHTREA